MGPVNVTVGAMLGAEEELLDCEELGDDSLLDSELELLTDELSELEEDELELLELDIDELEEELELEIDDELAAVTVKLTDTGLLLSPEVSVATTDKT